MSKIDFQNLYEYDFEPEIIKLNALRLKTLSYLIIGMPPSGLLPAYFIYLLFDTKGFGILPVYVSVLLCPITIFLIGLLPFLFWSIIVFRYAEVYHRVFVKSLEQLSDHYHYDEYKGIPEEYYINSSTHRGYRRYLTNYLLIFENNGNALAFSRIATTESFSKGEVATFNGLFLLMHVGDRYDQELSFSNKEALSEVLSIKESLKVEVHISYFQGFVSIILEDFHHFALPILSSINHEMILKEFKRIEVVINLIELFKIAVDEKDKLTIAQLLENFDRFSERQ